MMNGTGQQSSEELIQRAQQIFRKLKECGLADEIEGLKRDLIYKKGMAEPYSKEWYAADRLHKVCEALEKTALQPIVTAITLPDKEWEQGEKQDE